MEIIITLAQAPSGYPQLLRQIKSESGLPGWGPRSRSTENLSCSTGQSGEAFCSSREVRS